jgi:type I restriction enzyme S subunit
MATLKLTKEYQRYPKYKDSGVEWVGEIPAGWEVTRSKFLLRHRNTKALADDQQLTASQEKGVVPQSEYMQQNGRQVVQVITGMDILKHVEPNDFVISMRSFQGGIELSHHRGAVSSAYVVLEPTKNVFPGYYRYLLKSSQYVKALQLTSNLVRDGQALRFDNFSQVELPLVPLTEQQKIATYLDEKTAMIDAIIEKKKKQIELLREKRAAIINRAVTEVDGTEERLKYIVRERKSRLEKAIQGSKYVGLEHVESGTGRYIEAQENGLPEGLVDVFKRGDVLFGKLRPYLAKVLAPDFDGVCTGELLVLAPDVTKVRSRYLFYKLISRDFIKAVDDSTYGSKMPRANWQFIGNMRVVYPSLSEQDKIIEKLDSKLALIQKIGETLNKSITQLQEFKSALISHVVTGKVKV